MADNKIYFVRRKTWRSRVARSSAHDWKSCNGKKPFEGSNPSFSAKKHLQKQVLFFFASETVKKASQSSRPQTRIELNMFFPMTCASGKTLLSPQT